MKASRLLFALSFLAVLTFFALLVSSCSEDEASTPSGSSSGSSGSSGGSSGSSGTLPPAPTVSKLEGGVDPATGEIRYLSIGDSLTQGVGAPDLDTGSFPALLTQRWKTKGCTIDLLNVGISGYTTNDVIADEVPRIAEYKPTLITFQCGANDIAKGVTIEAYRANVKTILAAAKGSGARVLVIPQNEWFRSPDGPNYGEGLADKRAAYDAVLIEETNAKGAELVDLRLLFRQQADKNQWFSDGIHPTADAYVAWADELARVIPAPCGK